MTTTLTIGTPVEVLGGFEDGVHGYIVGRCERHEMPSFTILFGDTLIGGFIPARLNPVDDTVLAEYADTWAGEPYVLECYSCLATGTNHYFGLGRNRRCPNCKSYEVHNHEETS